MKFDHRFAFRMFLAALLGTIVLWLFAWHYDIRSASPWFILLWLVCPIVLTVLLVVTIVMSLSGRQDEGKASIWRVALYLVLLMIATAFATINVWAMFLRFLLVT